jgi:hypothetical protein
MAQPVLMSVKVLPGTFGHYRLSKPVPGAKVNYTQAGPGWIEKAPVSGAYLQGKIEAADRAGQSVLVEVRPEHLDRDITAGIDSADLRPDFLRLCGKIIFCADLYQKESGEWVGSFIHTPSTNSQQRAIFINSRFADGRFLQGLDFFPPLVEALSWLKATELSNDQKMLPFLFSLFTAEAIGKLINNFPTDVPNAAEHRLYYEKQFGPVASQVRLAFAQLGPEQQGQISPDIFSRYLALPGLGLTYSAAPEN